MGKGANCAELTLTSILDLLGIDNVYFHNAAIPLAGGFGGYKSRNGWMGACGSVAGGCAAIGVIMGGKEIIGYRDLPAVSLTAAKFAQEFEKQFGSVVCSELCGYDFSNPVNFVEYQKNDIWAKKCYRFVVWAIDDIRKVTGQYLSTKWGMKGAQE
jgi:hypothetical protein